MWRKILALYFVLCLCVVGTSDFVKTKGTKFVKNEKAFYFNGFNAYWLMYMASDNQTRHKVSNVFSRASKYGMNVARTWAFSDAAGDRPLQISPGNYSQDVFKGLDFVVAEAKKFGINVILSLVNNWTQFGGKKQYVQWAINQGRNLNSEDAFYSDPVVKGFYKNHIKAVVTRVNSITGIAYKDDPTIFAWELINEPRSKSDLSGKDIQEWITEMSAYLKSIDRNHLLEIGLEGFYGPNKKSVNPAGNLVGTDFISNNHIAAVDFATIHIYPDQWLNNPKEEVETRFAREWIDEHAKDSQSILKKPLVVAEFAKSSKSENYNVGVRDTYFRNIFERVYSSAKRGGACGGALFWQLFHEGMDNMGDGYEVVLHQNPSTADVIYRQSRRMSSLN
ncbi:hypothetical protein ACS0TY_029503 [Phlomoides rotata]